MSDPRQMKEHEAKPTKQNVMVRPKEDAIEDLDAPTHRRILEFLNQALKPEDLMHTKAGMAPQQDHHAAPTESPKAAHPIMDAETAHRVFEFRERDHPFGFRHVSQLLEPRVIDRHILEHLIKWLGYRAYGRWTTFGHPVPRRGDGSMDGVVHAAVLRNGKVLFITADQTTLLWDPENPTASAYSDPANQPHQMPEGYSQLCGHHVFLSNGQLLSVGGGGYGPHHLARWGYRYDPATNAWARTAGPMADYRWYPTAVHLGDGRVLIGGGSGSNAGSSGDMEVYDESTDRFTPVTLTEKQFPSLYPGFHLLPNRSVVYSRTGWASAGAGGGPVAGPSDDQTAFFTMTGHASGQWTSIAPYSASMADRTKGMSVLLMACTPPYVRLLVLGGADSSTNHTYEVLDATTLGPATNWGPSQAFPDGEHRSLASAVLLPDGNVFVCGGIQRQNSPCAAYDPEHETWAPMAAMPSVRDYHSVAVLLPSGKVAVAGWNNSGIEVFSPPYLFKGTRPALTAVPASVCHGQGFTIESPQAASIQRVVLVRPMAVTHQTDSEQRIVELHVDRDPRAGDRLSLSVPRGNAATPPGYYMLFAVNRDGVPSVASWIRVT